MVCITNSHNVPSKPDTIQSAYTYTSAFITQNNTAIYWHSIQGWHVYPSLEEQPEQSTDAQYNDSICINYISSIQGSLFTVTTCSSISSDREEHMRTWPLWIQYSKTTNISFTP